MLAFQCCFLLCIPISIPDCLRNSSLDLNHHFIIQVCARGHDQTSLLREDWPQPLLALRSTFRRELGSLDLLFIMIRAALTVGLALSLSLVDAQDNRATDPNNHFIYPPLPGPQFSNDNTVFSENLNFTAGVTQSAPFKWTTNLTRIRISISQEGNPDSVQDFELKGVFDKLFFLAVFIEAKPLPHNFNTVNSVQHRRRFRLLEWFTWTD